MKMKEDYQKETAEIIRVMSDYKTVIYNQIIRMFPDKSEIVEKIIKRLIKDKRMVYDEETKILSYGYEKNDKPDLNLITAFWILVDFYEGVDFHCPSEYPVQIAFFMENKFYEIIKVDDGKVAMINHILAAKTREPSDKIIIVGSEKQIPEITVENIFCFCTVDKTGEIEYFNFE